MGLATIGIPNLLELSWPGMAEKINSMLSLGEYKVNNEATKEQS